MSNHSNWSSSVGYGQFVLDSYVYFSNHLHQLRTEYRFPQQFFEDFIIVVRNNTDPLLTFTCIVLVAIILTGLRYAFTEFLIKPIARKYKLPKSEQEKLPECTWNFVYYSSSWLMTAYILLIKEKAAPFVRPESMWINYQFTEPLPIEYRVLYIAQLGFYFHSTYALIALDQQRKDATVMMVHHMIAMIMIFFGFSNRAHQAGTLVLFLHDICDVFLEGTKTAFYFKIQNNTKRPIFEIIANVCFALFCLVWIYSRMYTFPLRAIWSCATLTDRMNVPIRLWFLTNSLLYLLMVMNLYWFTFILKVMYRIVTRSKDLKDVREYDKETDLDEDDISSRSKETVKNLPIHSTTDTIQNKATMESTGVGSVYNLRKRKTDSPFDSSKT